MRKCEISPKCGALYRVIDMYSSKETRANHRLEETGDTTAKHNLRPWIGSSNRRITLVEKPVKSKLSPLLYFMVFIAPRIIS